MYRLVEIKNFTRDKGEELACERVPDEEASEERIKEEENVRGH